MSDEQPATETMPPAREDGATADDSIEASSGPESSPSSSVTPESLTKAFDDATPVEGKVIGWNKGGFHVVVDGFAAFCPRSEMEPGRVSEPRDYVDRSFDFKVIEVRSGGRRVVLSRATALREETDERARVARQELKVGAVVEGTVASITDFGAFVELGGVQGLIHISELSRRRVDHPSDVVDAGQSVEVKILKIERGGRRISLSRKALEPDPWKDVRERLREGTMVTGVVEKTERFGALIEIEPGLTGLLPSSEMSLPRDTSPQRAFPAGREVAVQIVSIDPRRRRISLAPKGAHLGGSRSDYEDYKKAADREMGQGFNALEAAFRKSRPQS